MFLPQSECVLRLGARRAVRRPIVQISRAADKLPFDVGQVRTIVVDTTDVYTLVPQLESLKAQIAAQIARLSTSDPMLKIR